MGGTSQKGAKGHKFVNLAAPPSYFYLNSQKINTKKKKDTKPNTNIDVWCALPGCRARAHPSDGVGEGGSRLQKVMECFLNENTPVFRTNMCH